MTDWEFWDEDRKGALKFSVIYFINSNIKFIYVFIAKNEHFDVLKKRTL